MKRNLGLAVCAAAGVLAGCLNLGTHTEMTCDIVIYGHTHRQTDKEVYGIRFLNPGAMKNGNYLIIETSGKGDLEVTLY